ncbi:MAG: NUDIX domain-containing protein [Flavobacteriales bacterium]|nr:NUDIX domain-containing protein [Flavobacteriales bacterium]MDG1780131.1 NUDIX domain-containing protein [Flavobacteriales bacterium]MDG2247031.1 NUDIX domain-containing protein [Flavobacteriales bacterium]
MYKVFISDRTLFILDRKGILTPEKSGTLFATCSDVSELDTFIRTFEEQPTVKELHLFSKAPEELFEAFKTKFKVIEAAGGLVRNPKGELLFIYRNDKWDLPKGKLEKGESIEDCAVREVAEECGIKPPTRGNKLLTTYHTYEHKGKKILKPTYWYDMQSDGNEELVPQLDEGITEVRWIQPRQLNEVLENTYPSIIDVISEGQSTSVIPNL